MNEKKVENEKKETDFEFNQNLIRLDSEEQVRQEKDYLERKEKEGAREERKREEIRNQWNKSGGKFGFQILEKALTRILFLKES